MISIPPYCDTDEIYRKDIIQIMQLVTARKNTVPREGIEPPTPAFSGPRSTTELPRRSLRLIYVSRIAKNGPSAIYRTSTPNTASSGEKNANTRAASITSQKPFFITRFKPSRLR